MRQQRVACQLVKRQDTAKQEKPYVPSSSTYMYKILLLLIDYDSLVARHSQHNVDRGAMTDGDGFVYSFLPGIEQEAAGRQPDKVRSLICLTMF